MISPHSRRAFVKLSSKALALATIGRRAAAQQLTRGMLQGRERGPGATDDSIARAVAMTALQVARDAGATYADVRVDATTEQFLSVWQRNESRPVEYMDDFTYGVRVIAKGQWGFAGGQDPSPDAVAQVARQAVEQAEATAAGGGRSAAVALAPAPVVTGVWETPAPDP